MIQVDIVTPTRKLVERAKASLLTLPGAKGELQILPGHADMLVELGTGVLTLQGDGTTRRFAVSYGFAEARRDKVTVLAETCEEADAIDRERAKQAQKKAEQVLGGTLEPGQFRKYELKLQRAMVRQQATS